MIIEEVKKQEIIAKNNKLNSLKIYLKNEFVGIDDIIDGVVDAFRPFYVFNECLTKPIVVNLWGMTGTGKTSLIEKIVDFLKLKNSYIKYDMGTNDTNYGFISKFGKNEDMSDISSNKVIVLDEFQIGRTINEDGKEKDNGCRYIWDLVDSGKITEDKNSYFEYSKRIIRKLKNLQYNKNIQINDKGYIVNVEEYLNNTKSFNVGDFVSDNDRHVNFGISYHKETFEIYCKDYDLDLTTLSCLTKDDFDNLFYLNPLFFNGDISNENRKNIFEKPLVEIINTVQHIIDTSDNIRLIDYSKSIIFCLGNLDEVYSMSKDTNPDINADIFHENSLKIKLTDVKTVLQKRFRVEQISRLGNIHFIYPAFSHNSYEKFIAKYLENVRKTTKDNFGLNIHFHASVNEIIYKEGVFPTQGIRPLFSTLSSYIENNLSKVLTDLILNNIITNNINWVYSDKKFIIKIDNTNILEYVIETKLEDLRKIDDKQVQALVSVHEAGHALLSAILMKIAPDEIVSKSVNSGSGGYCLYKNNNSYPTKSYLVNKIAILFGGVEAERLLFGDDNISVGCSSDLSEATNLIVSMYKNYSMYDEYCGRTSSVTDSDMSGNYIQTDNLERFIEKEIRRIRDISSKTLKENKEYLLKIANVLFVKQKIEKEEFKEIIKGLNIEWSDIYFDYCSILDKTNSIDFYF